MPLNWLCEEAEMELRRQAHTISSGALPVQRATASTRQPVSFQWSSLGEDLLGNTRRDTMGTDVTEVQLFVTLPVTDLGRSYDNFEVDEYLRLEQYYRTAHPTATLWTRNFCAMERIPSMFAQVRRIQVKPALSRRARRRSFPNQQSSASAAFLIGAIIPL